MTAYSHNENCLTPVMTSNTAPPPVVASASSAGSDAYYPFMQTAEYATTLSAPCWLRVYSGGQLWTVTSYTFTIQHSFNANSSWYLEGSLDGSSWVELDHPTGIIWAASYEMKTFTISSPGDYSYYRIRFDSGATNEILALELIGTIWAPTQVEGDIAESTGNHISPSNPADGKENLSTTTCTQVATSNTAPSPQIVSACRLPAGDGGSSYTDYYKMFDQSYSTYFRLNGTAATTSHNVMIDIGSTKLVNKVIMSFLEPLYTPKTWVFQGTNDVSAVVEDTVSAHGWTTLANQDSYTFDIMVGTYPTWRRDRTFCFSNGTAYSKYRFFITETDIPYGGYVYGLTFYEIALIEDTRAFVNGAVDTVNAAIYKYCSISESITATALALGMKDFEIDGVAETSVAVDAVGAIQDYQIGSIDETPSPTVTSDGRTFFDVTIPEAIAQTDTASAYFVTTGSVSEAPVSSDAVNVLKWSWVTIEVSDTLTVQDTAVCGLSVLVQEALGLSDSTAAMLGILVSEYLTMLDAQVVKHNGTRTIADGVFLEDDPKIQFIKEISEALGLTDSATIMLYIKITEILALAETQSVQWTGTNTINDGFVLTDQVARGLSLVISEALGLTDSAAASLELIISEFMSLSSTATPNWNTTRTLSDNFSLSDEARIQWIKIIDEVLTLVDNPVEILGLIVSEFMALSCSVIPNWNTTRNLSDGFSLSDEARIQWIKVISETLTLADNPTAILELFISEFMALGSTVTPNWNTTRTLSDTLTLADLSPMIALQLLLSESLTLTDAASNILAITVLEYLGFNDLVAAIGRFSAGVTDSLSTSDSASLGYSASISEVLSLVDVSSVVALLLNTISESLVLTETALGQLKLTLIASETLSLSDTVASQGVLYNVVYDTLVMNVAVELDGEIWECYVLNTPKFLPSIYSGFDFNSYCVFQNRAYGCKVDSIYELTGDTDNGVAFHTGVQLSETKFGIPNQKRFRKAYAGVSGTAPIMVMETEDGLSKAYTIDSDGEVDASRALRSKKWKLAVVDFETLDFIKLIPVVLAK